MPVEVSISGPALDTLKAFRETLTPEKSADSAGRGVRRLLMDYLAGLDSTRANAAGGKRTHFYASAARNISYDVDADGATVRIHQLGIAQRYYGGTITPINSKYLTIPVDPEAYGRKAGEFDNLTVQFGLTKSGQRRPMFLIQESGYHYKTGKNRKTGVKEVKSAEHKAGKIMYYLALSVHQEADKSVLPSDDLINQAAMDSITDYLLTVQRRSP